MFVCLNTETQTNAHTQAHAHTHTHYTYIYTHKVPKPPTCMHVTCVTRDGVSMKPLTENQQMTRPHQKVCYVYVCMCACMYVCMYVCIYVTH